MGKGEAVAGGRVWGAGGWRDGRGGCGARWDGVTFTVVGLERGAMEDANGGRQGKERERETTSSFSFPLSLPETNTLLASSKLSPFPPFPLSL